jgi:hypothetical protein
MERTIDDNVTKFVSLLDRKYVSTETDFRPMDFALKIQYFTLDVVADLAFGQAFGYMEEDRDLYDFIKTTRAFFPLAVLMSNLPILVTILHSPLFRGSLPKASDAYGFGAFLG